MTREVYPDKEFIEFSRSQVFVRVFVDTDPDGDRLARRFRLEGFPTFIILDSKGQEVDRIEGGMSAQDLIKALTDIFENADSGGISI